MAQYDHYSEEYADAIIHDNAFEIIKEQGEGNMTESIFFRLTGMGVWGYGSNVGWWIFIL